MNSTAYDQFSRTARQAAKTVIANYSTSFALATRFLGPSHRDHIRNIYALVRIADEIVDGLAADAGLTPEDQERLLESFVTATKTGLERGISDNLIIHAFAQTAQAAGITAELIDPFFDSMRTDLESAHKDLESPSSATRVLAQRPFSPTPPTRQNQPRPPVPPGPPTPPTHPTPPAPTPPVPSTPPVSPPRPTPLPRPTPQPRGLRGFDADEHSRYVYGSAEVVGLMCLTVFLIDEDRTPTQRERLEFGARQLGAAFQNINFLRDLADDSIRLGRSYLTAEGRLTETEKTAWVRTIRDQLAHAEDTMTLLPRDARAAVRSAAALFTALIDRIAETPVAELYVKRIRVPNAVKARLAAKAILTTAAEGRTLEHARRENETSVHARHEGRQ